MSGSALALPVATLAMRKEAEAARRKQAADAAVAAMRSYARKKGGRFVVFGSYVRDAMRHDSDLDVLVDFAPEMSPEAWSFVEHVCQEQGVAVDIHDARTTKAVFVERVNAAGLDLS